MENKALARMILPTLEALGFECVKLDVVGTTRSPIVRLYIDKEGGVSIKDCALVSRTLSAELDASDPFPGRYLLEVSSPGNDRPLTRQEHFERYIGEQARVQVESEELGKKTYTGQIRSCINEVLVMDTDEGEQLIPVAAIVKANLVGLEYKIDKKQNRKKKRKGEPK